MPNPRLNAEHLVMANSLLALIVVTLTNLVRVIASCDLRLTAK